MSVQQQQRQLLDYTDPMDRLLDYVVMAFSRAVSVPPRKRTDKQRRMLEALNRGRLGPLFESALELLDGDLHPQAAEVHELLRAA